MSGKVVIPEAVTVIGEKAFEDCRDVEDIILPDSVVSIFVGVSPSLVLPFVREILRFLGKEGYTGDVLEVK